MEDDFHSRWFQFRLSEINFLTTAGAIFLGANCYNTANPGHGIYSADFACGWPKTFLRHWRDGNAEVYWGAAVIDLIALVGILCAIVFMMKLLRRRNKDRT